MNGDTIRVTYNPLQMLSHIQTRRLSASQEAELRAKVAADPTLEATAGVTDVQGDDITTETRYVMIERKYRDFEDFSNLFAWADSYRHIIFPETNSEEQRKIFKRGVKLQVISMLHGKAMRIDPQVQGNICWCEYYSAIIKTNTKFRLQERLQAWKDCKVYNSTCGKGIVLDFITCQMSFKKPKGWRVWDLKPSDGQLDCGNENVKSKLFNPILAGDAQEHYKDGLTAGALEVGIARDILDEKGAREMSLLLNLALCEDIPVLRVSECDTDKMARDVSMLEELMGYAEVCGLEYISTIQDVCNEMMQRLYTEDSRIADVMKTPIGSYSEMDAVGQLVAVKGSSLSKKTKTLLSGVILMRATETEGDTFDTWIAKGQALNQMEASLREYIQD